MRAETPLPFRHTRPPPERLARIGVVLDTRAPWTRFAQLARICDEAGIDAVAIDYFGRTAGIGVLNITTRSFIGDDLPTDLGDPRHVGQRIPIL